MNLFLDHHSSFSTYSSCVTSTKPMTLHTTYLQNIPTTNILLELPPPFILASPVGSLLFQLGSFGPRPSFSFSLSSPSLLVSTDNVTSHPVEQPQNLGFLFDSSLSFVPHIQAINKSCHSSLYNCAKYTLCPLNEHCGPHPCHLSSRLQESLEKHPKMLQ